MTTGGGAPGRGGKANFLVRSALALVSTSVVTSGLGFIYWTVAARTFPVADVGQATTAIAAMSLIAPFTVLGFGTALVSKLPTMRSGRAELVVTAATVCALVACLVSLGCALVLPSSFLGLPGVGHGELATGLFMAGVAAHAVGLMLDNALLSTTGARIQLARNMIHSVVKLILLVVFALTLLRFGSLSIYATWFIAAVVSILAVAIWLIREFRVRPRQLLPRLSSLEGMHFNTVKHHFLNLSLSVPYFAMPIVANVILGSEQAGYLYATWSLAGFVFVLPIAMSTALFASSAKDSSEVLREFRFTLHASLAACVAANLLILPFGGLILSIFGRAYAENGRTVLIILCIGGLGLVIRDHHVAVARITGKVGREAALMIALGAGELTGAAIGASLSGTLLGLSLGWLCAVILETAVCAPGVWRAYRGDLEPASPDAPVDSTATGTGA